jgi:hypothetical protein
MEKRDSGVVAGEERRRRSKWSSGAAAKRRPCLGCSNGVAAATLGMEQRGGGDLGWDADGMGKKEKR